MNIDFQYPITALEVRAKPKEQLPDSFLSFDLLDAKSQGVGRIVSTVCCCSIAAAQFLC